MAGTAGADCDFSGESEMAVRNFQIQIFLQLLCVLVVVLRFVGLEIRAGLCGADPDSRDGALHRHSQTRIAGGNAGVLARIWRVCEVESDGSVAADEGGGEFGRAAGGRGGVPRLRDLVARDGK